jgi:hypothetical protein
MKQLEEDSGAGGIGPWMAAEHRNTAHHHVHIVLAARRELTPGRFQTVLITRPRLQRMKEAIGNEIDRQRGFALERDETPPGRRVFSRTATKPQKSGLNIYRWRKVRRSISNRRSRSLIHRGQLAAATLWRLQAVALRYQHQMGRELEEQAAGREREGWLR